MNTGFFHRLSRFSTKEKVAFRKKAVIFSFFLLLSVIFWFMNALSKNYTTTIDYPVRYRNFPVDKILIGELPEHLSLEVNAHGYTLLRYRLSSRYIPLVFNVRSFTMNRMNSADSGVYYIETRFARNYISKQLSSEFNIIDIKPDTLIFRFADVVSRKVPVIPDITFQLGKQLILKQEPYLIPDSVNVSGPDYIVDSLTEVRTRRLDAGTITQSVTKTADIAGLDHVSFGRDKVKVRFEVEKYTEKTLSVPVEVINLPDSLRMKTFPHYIQVTCQVGLSNFEKLQTSMFRMVVNYEETENGQARKVKVEMDKQPDFTRSVKYSPRSVEYLIEK
ncbi:MAG TPA: hypothetical protein VE870_03725 [Bacteroidales bacterium]|nr:hypothetical protein [Bacteroidales bacterium]